MLFKRNIKKKHEKELRKLMKQLNHRSLVVRIEAASCILRQHYSKDRDKVATLLFESIKDLSETKVVEESTLVLVIEILYSMDRKDLLESLTSVLEKRYSTNHIITQKIKTMIWLLDNRKYDTTVILRLIVKCRMAFDTEIEEYGLTVGEKGYSSDLDEALWNSVKTFQPFRDGSIDFLVPVNKISDYVLRSFRDVEWNFKAIQRNIFDARLPIITVKSTTPPLRLNPIIIREHDDKFRFRYPIHAVFCNICNKIYDDIKYIDITKPAGCSGIGPSGSYHYYVWYTRTELLCCPRCHIFELIY